MLRWNDWLVQARADRAAAGDLLATGHWDWCCFACQQSAEKFLKAVMDQRRIHHEGHSLPALARRLEGGGVEVPDEVHDACAVLNRFYIPTRSPDAHEEGAPVDLYRERDARNALTELTRLAEFAEPLVEQAPD